MMLHFHYAHKLCLTEISWFFDDDDDDDDVGDVDEGGLRFLRAAQYFTAIVVHALVLD